MASLVLRENPVILSGECIDWYHFYMVGLSALCYWLYYGMGIDKMVNQGERTGNCLGPGIKKTQLTIGNANPFVKKACIERGMW